MLDRLLPQRIDNGYRGTRPALWLFGLVVVMKAAQSLASIFNGHDVASRADGIPLDTFGPVGAQAVVSLLALLGLAQLVISLLGVVALVRYRAMVPLMFAVFVLEYLSRRLILHVMPIVRTGVPPGLWINLALLAVMIGGLALSLREREGLRARV